MRKGKLGLPRPLGIGFQFKTDTGRDEDVADIVEQHYRDLVEEMLAMQSSSGEEVLSVCYEDDSVWNNTGIVEEDNGNLIKPKLYNIEDLDFDVNSHVLNRVFSIHTHTDFNEFLSSLSLRDIHTHLSTLSTYGNNYIGEAAVARKDEDVIMVSVTAPSEIDKTTKDNIWRVENALEDFLHRVEEGEIQGVPGTEEFKDPIRIPGYGLNNEFKTVSEVRGKTRRELSAIGFKIQTTQL